MDENNCTQCRYTQRDQIIGNDGSAVIGKYQFSCHRFPPSAFTVPISGGGFSLASAFPVVTDQHICSLFEIDDREDANAPKYKAVPNSPLRLIGLAGKPTPE
jgi:hypothetical protein